MTFFSKQRIVYVSIGDFRFSWDIEKEAINVIKHQISFSEALTVFDDHQYLDDGTKIVDNEPRQHIIGTSLIKNHLYVVACEKHDEVIQIISARKATKEERDRYLKQFDF